MQADETPANDVGSRLNFQQRSACGKNMTSDIPEPAIPHTSTSAVMFWVPGWYDVRPHRRGRGASRLRQR